MCANTHTKVPPVAAEGGTSKEEHGRQRRRRREESLFGDIPILDVGKAIDTARDGEIWQIISPS